MQCKEVKGKKAEGKRTKGPGAKRTQTTASESAEAKTKAATAVPATNEHLIMGRNVSASSEECLNGKFTATTLICRKSGHL